MVIILYDSSGFTYDIAQIHILCIVFLFFILYDTVMLSLKRPFLVVSQLIEQPTWGGDYILSMKGWSNTPRLQGKRIGQSYELCGRSKLLISVTDTDFERFWPEFTTAEGVVLQDPDSHLQEGKDYVRVSQIVKHMPLLLKMNQAYGNSFQLHIKPNQTHPHWKPKPESWYYFEPGLVTFGIKEGIDVNEYKNVCLAVQAEMKRLSAEVHAGNMPVDQARARAQEFIAQNNPKQFVNLHETKKDSIIDLSMGAVHHSWEEDRDRFPNGNIVYEIQLDVMDPVCTIRSFDQAKMKNDGSIRKIHVEDYFEYIDTDPAANNIQNATRTPDGNSLLKTPYYSMDALELTGTITDKTGKSFVHLFVREGAATVKCADGEVRVGQGHSCFIPQEAGSYSVEPETAKAVLLKSYL